MGVAQILDLATWSPSGSVVCHLSLEAQLKL
jgi:hypothetical protein